MTIYAFGCSVTHGTEIAAPGNCKENIPFSYPALVANHLGVDCVNLSFCGNSNENIFHQVLETLPGAKDITAVIIGWTSAVRETWNCDGRTWQFIPSWCSSVIDVWQKRPTVADVAGMSSIEISKFDWTNKLHHVSATASTPSYCADQQEYIPVLENFYKLLISNKFDLAEYTKKTMHYSTAIRSYCQSNNLLLIETFWEQAIPLVEINLGQIGNWYLDKQVKRHPNKIEQQLMADQIIQHYKL